MEYKTLAVNLGPLAHPTAFIPFLKLLSNWSDLNCIKHIFFLAAHLFSLSLPEYGQKEKWACQYIQFFFLPHPILFWLNPVNSAFWIINNIINDTCLNTSLPSYLFYCHEERTIVYFYLLAKRKDFPNNQTQLAWFCRLRKSRVFPEEWCVIRDCSQRHGERGH